MEKRFEGIITESKSYKPKKKLLKEGYKGYRVTDVGIDLIVPEDVEVDRDAIARAIEDATGYYITGIESGMEEYEMEYQRDCIEYALEDGDIKTIEESVKSELFGKKKKKDNDTTEK